VNVWHADRMRRAVLMTTADHLSAGLFHFPLIYILLNMADVDGGFWTATGTSKCTPSSLAHPIAFGVRFLVIQNLSTFILQHAATPLNLAPMCVNLTGAHNCVGIGPATYSDLFRALALALSFLSDVRTLYL
jgi:hypothetical protein